MAAPSKDKDKRPKPSADPLDYKRGGETPRNVTDEVDPLAALMGGAPGGPGGAMPPPMPGGGPMPGGPGGMPGGMPGGGMPGTDPLGMPAGLAEAGMGMAPGAPPVTLEEISAKIDALTATVQQYWDALQGGGAPTPGGPMGAPPPGPPGGDDPLAALLGQMGGGGMGSGMGRPY